MTYLWMHKASQGYLVENLKSRTKSDINVISVEYKDNYVEEFVIQMSKDILNFSRNL